MKKLGTIGFFVLVAACCAQTVGLAESSTSAWPYYAEINGLGAAGIYEATVPLHVLDKSREDLADLRLYDQTGREIPYALSIRKDIDEATDVTARLFNQANVGSTAAEVSVDLGENPGEHNQVEIDTAGMNFRRSVDVEGSDNGSTWKNLTTDVIYSFASQTNTVASNRVSYPISRYRYLRVRVSADAPRDKAAPVISDVKVSLTRRAKGQITTWDVPLLPYQLLRRAGAPASSWVIDLGGRLPCDRLLLMITDESFSRTFEVEAIDDPQNIRLVASGELTRRLNEKPEPLTLKFDKEEYASKLRLVVTDYNNPTLQIYSIRAGAPLREMYFEVKQPSTGPLKLFFGNSKAGAPHYDFEKELAARLNQPPAAVSIGLLKSNADYRPEPLPFTERVPWLIYVVLTISTVALGLILLSLARTTIRKQPKSSEPAKSGA